MYSNDIVCDILDFVDNNLLFKFSIDDICKSLNYNRFYLMKLFKKELGVSINSYINMVKVYKSLSFIRDGNSFLSVSLKCGFYSLEYFSEMFKKILGVSPSIYKKIVNYNNNIDLDSYDLCVLNLSILEDKLSFISDYKSRRKPKISPVKKLSIFV